MKIASAPVFSFRDSESCEALKQWRADLKAKGASLVFTNGVFDILHAGHVSYLLDARNSGDALIIGLNSDTSVRSIKGPKRPLQPEGDRAHLLASLRSTDAVAIFDQDTPLEIITFLLPDILIKGADYSRETIVGADIVEQHGGRVLTIPLSEGRSTTNIVDEVLKRYR
jgi:rfaE bifunctional protein nucleotidyltransferase chain/domain